MTLILTRRYADQCFKRVMDLFQFYGKENDFKSLCDGYIDMLDWR